VKSVTLTDDLDVLSALFDYPAEHWIHLRTTNPTESTFATARLRQRVIEEARSVPAVSRQALRTPLASNRPRMHWRLTDLLALMPSICFAFVELAMSARSATQGTPGE
jgi:transposase-like protein